MLKITANGVTYEFDPDRMTFAQGRDIEAVTGEPIAAFGENLKRGDLTALQALVWAAARRTQPDLDFSDLDDWVVGELDIDSDDADAEADAADPQLAVASATTD